MNITDLIKRVNAETHPSVTNGELALLKKYTGKVTEYEMLCGKLYKFENKQMRIL